MSWDPISGIGGFNQSGSLNPVAYQQRTMARQNLLSGTSLYPVAQPSMQEIAMLQGYYNNCLGNIDQLRYGSSYPSLFPMMSSNPQMLMLFMMYQQMQMQTMLLMMMLMMRQNGISGNMMQRLTGGGQYAPWTRGGRGEGAHLPTPYTGGKLSDPNKAQVNQLIENAAAKYGIPPNILKAIAWQESRWNANAVGDGGKSFGMMQIYTSAHPDYKVQDGKQNVEYNIEYGARLLRSLYDRYGSWEKAVERYNGSGPMAVRYASSVINHSKSKPWMA